MPITPTEAKLWFDTKEEQDLYDEKMIANIELKSLDFDDENFSPVFDRAKQEFFLEPGEKMKSDFDRLNKPLALHSVEELIDRYWLYKPNHTYFRTWTFDKFLAGFGFGYVLLRELPLRNFYARCLVMSLFASKLLDHFDNIWPSFVPQGTLTLRPDPWIK